MAKHKVHGKHTSSQKGTGHTRRKKVTASWRLAKSLKVLLMQINSHYQERSKKSDGTIGDDAHSKRHSDHNPNAANVVCAIDVTHDPKSGLDARVLADTLRRNADPRLNYVISNREIAKSGEQWKPYNGTNPHEKHCHISVSQDAKTYDSEDPWRIFVLNDTLEEKFRPDIDTESNGVPV